MSTTVAPQLPPMHASERWLLRACLLLPLAALVLFFGVPMLAIAWRSLVQDTGGIGWGNYAALLDTPGPALLHVAIDARANVWPLVPPNNANSTMLESNPAHQSQEFPNAIPA